MQRAGNDDTIAVVGGGIAGLATAWLLSSRHRVTLIEKAPRLGGHSNTVEVETADGTVAVDTGFIVYNTRSYPNLMALFEHFEVPTAKSNMSFAVSLDRGAYEYSGTGLGGLFGQPSNALRPSHWRMLADIRRFFREARAIAAAANPQEHGESLGRWLDRRGYGAAFVERHILPMGAAIWSTPSREMLSFPVAAFARFFANHGLLQVRNRPEWRTVVGGSREYVRRLRAASRARVIEGDPVRRVSRGRAGVEIQLASGTRHSFDHAVLACHADEALAVLDQPSEQERLLLGAFRYAVNRAVLHRDSRHMPHRRRLWSSWNFIGATASAGSRAATEQLCVTYWMNRLQPLGTREPVFVTLNPVGPIEPGRALASFDYAHPMLDGGAVAAQRDLWSLQGRQRTWFCGSYFGHGFHEDALQSGLAVAEALAGTRRPWTVAGESSRIHLPENSEPRLPVVAA